MQGSTIKTQQGHELLLLECIGTGASSKIYKAKDESNHIYAVKIFKKTSEELSISLKDELYILARMKHQYISQAYEVGAVDGSSYMVMEYFDGETLEDYVLKNNPITIEEIIEIFIKIASSLHELHKNLLTHRDLKFDNILINANKEIRLLDFGLAKKFENDQKHSYLAGNFLFSSPEQSRVLQRPVDHRSDLYSLGVLMFYCLTGEVPYQSDSVQELLKLHLNSRIPKMDTFRSDIPPSLEACIEKLLQKDPDNRYQSSLGLIYDLESLSHLNSLSKEKIYESLDAKIFLDKFSLYSSFVGRNHELTQLTRCYQSLDSPGETAMVLFEGAPGSGKSRIIWEFFQRNINDTSNLYLYGKCNINVASPFYVIQLIFKVILKQLSDEQKSDFIHKIQQHSSIISEDLYFLEPKFFLPFKPQDEGCIRNAVQAIESIVETFNIASEFFNKTVWFLDDIQWIDSASLKVLNRIMYRKKSITKIFVIISARNDSASLSSLNKSKKLFENKIKFSQQISALDVAESYQYISDLLGFKDIEEGLCDWIIDKAKGNPFALKEYTNMILDQGIVEFSWGKWSAKEGSLSTLDLPDDIIKIVLKRLKKMNIETLEMISVGSLSQGELDVDLLSYLLEKKPEVIKFQLMEAIDNDVIQKNSDQGYSFSHDRIIEASQNLLTEEKRKKTHSDIAVYLNKNLEDREKNIYKIAYHYRNSLYRFTKESFEANFEAGRLSISDNAFKESEVYLVESLNLKNQADEVSQANLYRLLGYVYFRNNKHNEALTYYDLAIHTSCFNRLEKAKIFQMKSSIYMSLYNGKKALENAKLAALMIGYDPLNMFKLLSVFFSKKHSLFLKKHKKEDVGDTVVDILTSLGHACYFNFDIGNMIKAVTWVILYRIRFNLTLKEPKTLAILAVACGSVGLTKMTYLFAEKAHEFSKNNFLKVFTLHYTGIAYDTIGEPLKSLEIADANITDYKRWMDPINANDALDVILHILTFQGHFERAITEIDRFFQDQDAEDTALNMEYFTYKKSVFLTLMGHFKEASVLQKKCTSLDNIAAQCSFMEAQVIIFRLLIVLATNDLQEVDPLEQEWNTKVRQHPLTCVFHAKYYYIILAQIRFEICMNQYLEQGFASAENISVFKKSLFTLKLTHHRALFKNHHTYLQAGLEFLHGRYDQCKILLEEAKSLSDKFDAVWTLTSSLRLEMHIMKKKKRLHNLKALLKSCLSLIKDYKLGFLEHRVLREFEDDIEEKSTSLSSSGSISTQSLSSQSGSHDVEKMRMKNYLDALLRISIAASKSKTFNETICHCIDEILSAVSGERGFIFSFINGKTLSHGRDQDRETIEDFSDISSSVIKKVKSNHLPVLLQNNMEEFSTSASIVAQDVKSIVAVPMMLQDELIGVIYLDSHSMRGIFTQDDIYILQAASNHVAVAIESSRAADIELERREALKDLEVTGAVQNLLLPQLSEYSNEKYKMKSYFQSATQSGGDWWWSQDFNGSTLCFVGDVTGHGPGPAMITSSIAGAYQAQEMFLTQDNILESIPNLMKSFQNCLCNIGQNEYWMSMAALFLDTQNNQISYWSAGSPPPIVLRESGKHFILNHPSSPLGSNEFFLHEARTLPVEKGDKIILYTDGAYEITNEKHHLTIGKFKKNISKWDHTLSVEGVFDHMLTLINEHMDGYPQEDDITFTILEVL